MDKNILTRNKKMILSMMLVIIVVLIIGVLLSAIFLKSEYVEVGDCIEVEYIGRFLRNNTIFFSTYNDTLNKTGGKPTKLFVNPDMALSLPRGYELYTSAPELMPPGVVRGLLGMREGETRFITVSPDEAYGDWNTTLVQSSLISAYNLSYYPRYTYYNFIEEIMAEYLPFEYPCATDPNMNYGSLTVNQTYVYLKGTSHSPNNSSWVIKIIGINGSYVTIQHIVSNGTIVNNPGMWNSTIIIVNSTIFKERADPVVNTTLSNTFEGFFYHLKVIGLNETGIFFAVNSKAPSAALVGESLIYECRVTRIHKTSKS
ncbi:MAG: FKBP-type peptidyl-prolyl cis-trans isomerase [Candidatus Thermoplasmatota archaeon]